MTFSVKTAFKYIFSKSHGQRNNTILAILGIALSVLAVIVVTSIMNGLQNNQIQRLRNIESFDIIIENSALTPDDINRINGVEQSFYFYETSVLIKNKTSEKSIIARLRALDFDVIYTSRISNDLSVSANPSVFNDGLSISFVLQNELNYLSGNEIQVTFLRKGKTATLAPKNTDLVISGNYSSAINDFNSSTVLLSLNQAKEILGDENCKIGIFVDGKIQNIVREIRKLDSEASVITWQKYNIVLYSALVLEKAIVYLFLFFMFIILFINLKNSIERLINIKVKENAILMAMGEQQNNIRKMYLLQGLFITVAGEAFGLVLSKLFLDNLSRIFALFDTISYELFKASSNLSAFVFFVDVNFTEIFIVLIIVIILSVLFVLSACKKMFKKQIMEVVLNESY